LIKINSFQAETFFKKFEDLKAVIENKTKERQKLSFDDIN